MVTRRRGERRDGYVLVVVLFASLVAMTAAALVLGAYAHDTRLFSLRDADLHLTALCDAGLALALAELDRNEAWNGIDAQALDRGTFGVEVGWPGPPGLRRVQVAGQYRGLRRRVVALVDLTAGRPRVVSWSPEGSDPFVVAGEGRERP